MGEAISSKFKRNFASSIVWNLVIVFIFTSCSWVSKSRRSTFDGKGASPAKAQPRAKEQLGDTVSKREYDDLLRKYEELNKLYLKEKEMKKQNKLLTDLNSIGGSPNLNDTVDVFNKGVKKTTQPEFDYGLPEIKSEPFVGEMSRADEAKLENEIGELRKTKQLLAEKKFEKAMGKLQPLEQSKFRQIRVRAKFLIGSLLLEQREYDLALQVFEEIIQKYAFSHVVLNALEGLVVCSEKLNLPQKRDQYYSMLSDVFGR